MFIIGKDTIIWALSTISSRSDCQTYGMPRTLQALITLTYLLTKLFDVYIANDIN